MIPEKILPFFLTTREREKYGSVYTEGSLSCCGGDCFGVDIWAEVMSGRIFSMYLTEKNHRLVLGARCRSCGKSISLFDSGRDGYDACSPAQEEAPPLRPLACKKCGKADFSLLLRYEYPPMEDLEFLNLPDPSNRFTWIQATLRCKCCGAVYKNFLDWETG